jgi:eukaryotic-like serine/threonine-protein kinase
VPPPDPHLGKIYGNVLLKERLGHGAMGAVYRGWHERFAHEVAVKVLLNLHAKGSVKERFLREGQAAAKVRHEHVVQVMDAGEQDGVAYLVMELVNGYSLGRIVDEKGPLPCEAVARIGAQIALGLAAIHAQGIIHRDIKPDNILVGSDRKVKITDLGLAKQTDDPELNRLTATGMVVGTPLYVSPEAIRDPRSCTIAADVYSLGATLYHLLAGHPPFQAESPYEVMRAHLEQRHQPLRELRNDIPAGLAQLVDRCLSKAPERRPTALQLAELLSGGANLKASASRGLATLVGIAAVVVLGSATLGWFGLQRLRHAQTEAAATAIVTIVSAEPDSEVRIADGAWQPVAAAGHSVAPGTHRLEVRARRSGPLLRYIGEVTVADGGRHAQAVDLQPVVIPQVRIPVAGDGMLYAEGVAFGTDQAFTTTNAGTYALGRWNGNRWQTCTATIDERGQVAVGAIITRDQPEGGAWWRTRGESGQSLERHHVACWWEVERERKAATLAAPPGWLIQGQRTEQPAMGLTPGLIEAFLRGLGGRMELPTPTQALRLSGDYRGPVWCSDDGRLAPVGGNAVNALLILVPGETPSTP